MAHSGSSKQQLEDLWRERLVEVIRRYRIAKVESDKAAMESRNEGLQEPDGQFTYRQALHVETTALAAYKRVLEIFNDLILDKKFPPAA